MSIVISRDEWLVAVDEALKVSHDPTAITMREFAAKIGLCLTQAKIHMQRLIETGKAEKVTRVITRIDGQSNVVPAYRLKKTEQ